MVSGVVIGTRGTREQQYHFLTLSHYNLGYKNSQNMGPTRTHYHGTHYLCERIRISKSKKLI